MAVEDKKAKTKIDLKARLKEKGLATQAGVPLPVPGGSQPPSGAGSTPVPTSGGIAPPPGISPGIPVPPFAQPKAPTPSVPPPPKPTAVQQTIKVEESEVIHQERKKARRNMIFAGVGAAVLGIAIGFPIGGEAQKSDRAKNVVRGAKELLTDVKAANDKMNELDGLLNDAADKLGKKQYPTDLAGQLGGVNIPFDASKVDGTRIAGLKASVLRMLLNYTSQVEDLNKKKDSLKNLLEAVKPDVEKSWKEEKEPVVNFSVIFRSDQKGVIAELVKTKDPFAIGAAWPENVTVQKPERTQQGIKYADKPGKRYVKGDLPGTDQVIPVDPTSTAIFTSQEVVYRLQKAFIDLRIELKGDKSDPRNEIPGVTEIGDQLATEIQKITNGSGG